MRWRAVLFSLACGFWFLMLPVSLFLAVMAPSLSASGTNTAVWVLMLNFFTWPLICLLAPVAGWIAYRKGRHRLACAFVAAPLLWMAIPAAAWTYLANNPVAP